MRMLITKRWMAAFMSLALIVVLVAPSLAGEKHKIAGKMTMVYEERKTVEVGDTEEHVLSFGVAEGTNECTSEHTFMNGAQVMNMSFGDLVQGDGPHQGYVKLILKDDAVFCRWRGRVATTVPEEGAPIVSFEGRYSYIKGTGRFENIKGSGTYKGAFTSKTEYTVEWEGEYFIEE